MLEPRLKNPFPLLKDVSLCQFIRQLFTFNNVKLMFSNTHYTLLGIHYKRNENLCSYKNVYVNIHSSIIRNSQEGKRTPNGHQLMNG